MDSKSSSTSFYAPPPILLLTWKENDMIQVIFWVCYTSYSIERRIITYERPQAWKMAPIQEVFVTFSWYASKSAICNIPVLYQRPDTMNTVKNEPMEMTQAQPVSIEASTSALRVGWIMTSKIIGLINAHACEQTIIDERTRTNNQVYAQFSCAFIYLPFIYFNNLAVALGLNLYWWSILRDDW